jgi:D-glycero-D-manno-heptose 1,7-bisphosphate phosphatase
MKRAAIFFDRDNTLIANDGYLGDPNGVALLDGAADAVARARALGYAVVVFSNQSGVARGMFGEEAVHAVNHRLDEMLLDDNPHAVIDRHEFCPYHPEATVERYRQDSDLRKPKPGMILQAERQLALDLSRSWVVGDAPRDIDAGKAAGCRAILVKNGSLPESPASREPGSSHADYTVESLAEAMEVIARHPAPNDEPAVPATPIVERPGEPEAVEETTEVVPSAADTGGAPAAVTAPPPVDVPAAPREPARVIPIAPALSAPANAKGDADDQDDDDPDDTPELTRGKSRQEILLGQILDELRRRHEHPESDFSVSKLMAGVVQILALAAVFYAYMTRDRVGSTPGLAMLVAIFLQTFTIALLIMGRQK